MEKGKPAKVGQNAMIKYFYKCKDLDDYLYLSSCGDCADLKGGPLDWATALEDEFILMADSPSELSDLIQHDYPEIWEYVVNNMEVVSHDF